MSATKPGICSYCERPVLLVLRSYPKDCGGGTFWSLENCGCINGLRSPAVAARLTSKIFAGRGRTSVDLDDVDRTVQTP